MKKLITLSTLLAGFSFQSFSQPVELNQVFTHTNKITQIQVPLKSFLSQSQNGECNGLPADNLHNVAACSIIFMIDRDFRQTHIGPDFVNIRDNMLVGAGYGPKVLEELKKTASDGTLTGNLFVKYLYQPAWHTIGSHGGPATSICSLIEVPLVSLEIKINQIKLEFKNAPSFMTLGQPYIAKGRLDDSLCPKLK